MITVSDFNAQEKYQWHPGTSSSEIGNQAPYPASVRRMLGESLVASVLMSSTLKFEGTLSLQAQGDGPLRTLMAECSHDRFIRGLARYDEHAVTEDSLNALLGEGRMAITISPDKGQRYQGVVPREEESLAGCLEEYFERSEQIPTSFFLFADENCSAGLMLQKLPGDTEQDSDLWDRLNHLASTVEAEELLTLDSETVLHRLFNEETVRLFDAEPVAFRCRSERWAPWNPSARRSATVSSTSRVPSKWTASSVINTIASIEMILITFSPAIRYTEHPAERPGSQS